MAITGNPRTLEQPYIRSQCLVECRLISTADRSGFGIALSPIQSCLASDVSDQPRPRSPVVENSPNSRRRNLVHGNYCEVFAREREERERVARVAASVLLAQLLWRRWLRR